jgi:hypothetical protein
MNKPQETEMEDSLCYMYAIKEKIISEAKICYHKMRKKVFI